MTARFHDDELDPVERAAEAAGLTTAHYVTRASVAAATGRDAPRPIARDRALRIAALRPLNRLHAELRAIGNNVNQIARIANTTGQVPPDADIVEALGEALAQVQAVIVRLSVEDPR